MKGEKTRKNFASVFLKNEDVADVVAAVVVIVGGEEMEGA